MSSALLITRPDHDLYTRYLFHWSSLVIKEAIRKGIRHLDLKGKKANRRELSSYLRKRQPALVVFNGHGNQYVIEGYDNEVLIEVDDNEALLSDCIVYARSCDAANDLGGRCVSVGTRAFIGYKRKYAIGYTPSSIADPLGDELAVLFLGPSNLVPASLLKGNTVKDAYRKSQRAMWRNFQFMLSARALPSQKDAAPYLWSNRKHQVALGDQDAKL